LKAFNKPALAVIFGGCKERAKPEKSGKRRDSKLTWSICFAMALEFGGL